MYMYVQLIVCVLISHKATSDGIRGARSADKDTSFLHGRDGYTVREKS